MNPLIDKNNILDEFTLKFLDPKDRKSWIPNFIYHATKKQCVANINPDSDSSEAIWILTWWRFQLMHVVMYIYTPADLRD